MEIKELENFCAERHQWLKKHYHREENKELTFPITIKIMEELGELSEALLSHHGLQRNDKLDHHNLNRLKDEFADVLITLGILSHNLGIDLEESLQSKIKKIKQRDQ